MVLVDSPCQPAVGLKLSQRVPVSPRAVQGQPQDLPPAVRLDPAAPLPVPRCFARSTGRGFLAPDLTSPARSFPPPDPRSLTSSPPPHRPYRLQNEERTPRGSSLRRCLGGDLL